MGIWLFAVLLAQTGQIRTTDAEVGGAPDVRGYRRGVDALAYDPAASAFADGVELQYRLRLAGDERSSHGAYAVRPGRLTWGAGYEWFPGKEFGFERGHLNLALRLGELAIGSSYQRYRTVRGEFGNSGSWNVGLFAEPTSWLSVSAGVDAANSPVIFGERQNFAYRLGGSVRPFLGDPWLTVGAETRLDGREYVFGRTRGVVALAYESVRGFVAYDLSAEELWAGLSFGFPSGEVRGSAGFSFDDDLANETRGAFAFTHRSRSEGTPWASRQRKVEVALRGDLRRDRGLFAGKEAIALLSYRLESLAQREDVSTVVLSIGPLSIGLAAVESLRRAIDKLKASGKRVVAELGSVDDRGYMIAAAADEIHVDPAAILEVNGFSTTRRFFADTLAKIGVRFSAVAIGDYKSGPDPLTRNQPRPENDEVVGEILDHNYALLISILQRDRGFSVDEAKALVDRGIFTGTGAQEAGLADHELYPDDPGAVVKPRRRGENLEDLRRPSRRWGSLPRIDVIPIVGTIADEQGFLPGESTSPRSVIPRIDRARRDRNVEGVVLFIDSPGGAVGASEEIWRAVKQLAAEKPVITCMGDVAASGGYWIATATDTIIAEAGTLTGSIGIFQLKVDFERLYEMIELNAVVDKRGELADVRTETRGTTEREREQVQSVLEEQYTRFVRKVAKARKIDVSRARELGGGRVYTGRRALDLNLVDRLGSLADAVALVAERADLQGREYRVSVPTTGSVFNRALKNLVRADADLDVLEALGASIDRLRALNGAYYAVMPTHYEIEW